VQRCILSPHLRGHALIARVGMELRSWASLNDLVHFVNPGTGHLVRVVNLEPIANSGWAEAVCATPYVGLCPVTRSSNGGMLGPYPVG
jgi:hypothetical protein